MLPSSFPSPLLASSPTFSTTSSRAVRQPFALGGVATGMAVGLAPAAAAAAQARPLRAAGSGVPSPDMLPYSSIRPLLCSRCGPPAQTRRARGLRQRRNTPHRADRQGARSASCTAAPPKTAPAPPRAEYGGSGGRISGWECSSPCQLCVAYRTPAKTHKRTRRCLRGSSHILQVQQMKEVSMGVQIAKDSRERKSTN